MVENKAIWFRYVQWMAENKPTKDVDKIRVEEIEEIKLALWKKWMRIVQKLLPKIGLASHEAFNRNKWINKVNQI